MKLNLSYAIIVYVSNSYFLMGVNLMYLFALRKNTAQLVVTSIICIDFYFRSEKAFYNFIV